MSEKYRLTILGIGEMASEIFEEGLLIFFGNNAPGELKEVSIVHDGQNLQADIVQGDIIQIGDTQVTVLCVGEVVNDNLRNLGHMVIKFNGIETPENPGDINVEKRELPDIQVGMEVLVLGK